ncbi:MAG: response regulator [Ignavibacteria bacterium]|nr:response regulator [Ignavibacteria bacterium]
MEKKKILYVDDDPDQVEQNKLLLESKGYFVLTAFSGKEGWEVYKQNKPDAVVIDLIMEEHDSGFILSYKIKKESYSKKIPVFIVTSAAYLTGFKFGSSTEEEKEWIKCDAILNKPVVLDELVQKLDEFWALHQA